MDVQEENMDIKLEYEAEINSTELLLETLSLPNQTKSIAIWSNEETKKLIDLYRRFLTDIGPFNRFKRKKDMWLEISSQIPTKSAKQCEERLKTILKRKKKGLIEKVYLSNTKRKLMDLDDECENELSIVRKQKINTKADECITASRSIQVWSNSETKLLVELYKNFINEIGPQKRFMHKNDMWEQISSNFSNKDPRQCEQRFNTVIRRKKPGMTKTYVTKARRKTVDLRPRHFMETSPIKSNIVDDGDVVDDVDGVDDVDDDIVINEDVMKPEEKEECNEQPKTSAEKPKFCEGLSLCETLEKIAAIKEEGKERRHREKMEGMAKIQFIMQQMMARKK